jgi:hypothetical protein
MAIEQESKVNLTEKKGRGRPLKQAVTITQVEETKMLLNVKHDNVLYKAGESYKLDENLKTEFKKINAI